MRNFKIEVLKDIFVAVGIFEADVTEFYIAVKFFPIFFFGRECIAVFCNYFGCDGNVGFRFKQLGKTFYIYLLAYEIRYHVNYPADGFHYSERIRHKHRKRAYFHITYCVAADKRKLAAFPYYYGERYR